MSRWLFDSSGKPIAFVHSENVFSHGGEFIGRLDGDEVWRGQYKGEIVNVDRLLYRNSRGAITRGTPGTPGRPGIPGRPGPKAPIGIPFGYRDFDLDDV